MLELITNLVDDIHVYIALFKPLSSRRQACAYITCPQENSDLWFNLESMIKSYQPQWGPLLRRGTVSAELHFRGCGFPVTAFVCGRWGSSVLSGLPLPRPPPARRLPEREHREPGRDPWARRRGAGGGCARLLGGGVARGASSAEGSELTGVSVELLLWAGRLVLRYSLLCRVGIRFPRGWSGGRGDLRLPAGALHGNSLWSLGAVSLLRADGTGAPHGKQLQRVVKLLFYILLLLLFVHSHDLCPGGGGSSLGTPQGNGIPQVGV